MNKAANFNRRKNIRLVNWNNATWQIDGSGRAYNTPTLGGELLTDGGLENWSSATDLTNWIENIAGLSTINRESNIVASGTYAARFDVDSASPVYLQQNSVLTSGAWYTAGGDFRNDGSTRTIYVQLGTAQLIFPALTQTYQNIAQTGRANGTIIYFFRLSAVTHKLYLDNLTCRAISLPTTLATVAGSTNNLTVAAKINTIITGTQVGVASLIDSSSNPQNFIIAYHDGTNVLLEKCVSGVYTQLISTAVTFVTNAQIEIRRPSGNTFQLWYNGVQINTDQTVSDSEIINNNLYGIFSTYSGNLISEFTLGGVVIPFTF